jgi:predicted nucleic acid-binding protein
MKGAFYRIFGELDLPARYRYTTEREAIRLAQELEADALIMDEPAGREAAKRQGLRVIGTLRVLYDAAAAGLCDLAQAYERLQHTTFRAHADLYKAFLDMHIQRRV